MMEKGAAANLGDGAGTFDSVFHTNSENAKADLSGDSLDRLLEKLRHVKLLVIDEISTVGAAQFEIISRRLDQVGESIAGAQANRSQHLIYCDINVI